MKQLLFFLLLVTFSITGFAQTEGSVKISPDTEVHNISDTVPPQTEIIFGGSDIQPARPLQDIEFLNTLIVVIFGLVIFILAIFRIKSDQVSSEDFFRLIILTLIIIATMFLIAAGWDNQQTAPAFGILGTIAGYLLGRQSK